MMYHDYLLMFFEKWINFLGSPYPNYAAYSTTPTVSPSNATPTGYAAVQPIPYMQPYPAIFGKLWNIFYLIHHSLICKFIKL